MSHFQHAQWFSETDEPSEHLTLPPPPIHHRLLLENLHPQPAVPPSNLHMQGMYRKGVKRVTGLSEENVSIFRNMQLEIFMEKVSKLQSLRLLSKLAASSLHTILFYFVHHWFLRHFSTNSHGYWLFILLLCYRRCNLFPFIFIQLQNKKQDERNIGN